jgi:flavin reductase (DIM6/NTAB) family NADH-FMN oxidoreductase RutF
VLGDAREIDAPLVEDCRAHLECQLRQTVEIGSGFVVFGEIVAASIWEEVLRVAGDRRYELLDQIVFLENGAYAPVNQIVRV